jgi:hypothetical protein
MGLTLAGAMVALRERGVVPQVVAAVSSGAHAAYAALSEHGARDALGWFKRARRFMLTKPLVRFLPPYDLDGTRALAIAQDYGSDPEYLRSLGVKHFYVGYTVLPSMRFVAEDILLCSTRMSAYLAMLKTSAIPFVSLFAPHCLGAIDGGFRRMAFSSACASTRERWLLTYRAPFGKPLFRCNGRIDRMLTFTCTLKSPFFATDRQLESCFESGYTQAMRIGL